MKLQLPFLHKKSLRDPSKPPDGSVYSPSPTHAGSPSSFRGQDGFQPDGSVYSPSPTHADSPSSFRGQDGFQKEPNASPGSKNAELALSSRRLASFELRELEEAFNVFDANHDGKISVEELGSVLRSLGDNPSEQELMQMVRDVDRDGDGFIDLDEFQILHSSSEGRMNSDKELREAFRFFDADKNGFISVKELHNVMKRLRRSCSVEECRKMIKGVDKDGDGQVSFEEFQKMMA